MMGVSSKQPAKKKVTEADLLKKQGPITSEDVLALESATEGTVHKLKVISADWTLSVISAHTHRLLVPPGSKHVQH